MSVIIHSKSFKMPLPMLETLLPNEEKDAHSSYGEVFEHVVKVAAEVKVGSRKQGVVSRRYGQKHGQAQKEAAEPVVCNQKGASCQGEKCLGMNQNVERSIAHQATGGACQGTPDPLFLPLVV